MQGEVARVAGAVALASARGVWRERAGLLVTVRADGTWGQGEASPLPGYSRETLTECEAALERAPWRRLDVGSVAEVAAVLAEWRAPAAARCALEAALLDRLARRAGVPLWRLLGGAPGELALSALVGDAADVHAAAARGVRTCKIKVGRDWDAELALARTVRAAGLTLRADANGAWSPSQAPARLAALAALGVELVEEPGVASDLLRVAADESLLDGPSDSPVIVLKPMLLGGILRCLALAQESRAEVVVTHMWDGPVGLALAAALAFALPRARVLACGLDRHPGLAAWPAVDLPFLHAATVSAPAGPGLGIAEVRP